MYAAESVIGFRVSQCVSRGNLYNFGGIVAFDGVYENCTSVVPVCAGFCFEDCSDFTVKDCILQKSAVYDVYTIGSVTDLVLTGNQSDRNLLSFTEVPADWVNAGNSWNMDG